MVRSPPEEPDTILSPGPHTYQFNFNPWAHPERHLPFPFTEERLEDIISQAENLDMDLVRKDIEATRAAKAASPA